jgi:hypothetical protein
MSAAWLIFFPLHADVLAVFLLSFHTNIHEMELNAASAWRMLSSEM